jgi:hypothetical protein
VWRAFLEGSLPWLGDSCLVLVTVYIGVCCRPAERQVSFPRLFGCSRAVTEVCRFRKFHLVSVYFKFGFLVTLRHARCPPGGGEQTTGPRYPRGLGVFLRLVCFCRLAQFTFWLHCKRESFIFVMHIIWLVIVVANGRLLVLIVTKIVGTSVGPLGCYSVMFISVTANAEIYIT